MPTQSDTVIHVRAPADLVRRLDEIAQVTDRTRNYVARRLLEHSVTGADRLKALQAISAAELEQFEAAVGERERGPNPGNVIAESSADGHRRLAALAEIAKGSK